MLIVIGGDSYYKDEDEEDRFVISRWARRKVASQFNEEYLDGRKSFIFSWDTKHRPIHEEALRHYLDPSKKGFKFAYTPKPKPLQRATEPEFIPLSSQDARQEVGLFPCYILSVYFDMAPCTVFLFFFFLYQSTLKVVIENIKIQLDIEVQGKQAESE